MQQVDDPPSLPVGTEVSAKYKGAFCEAKVSKVVRNIKVKVAYKHGLGSGAVSDDAIKSGALRVGAVVEVKHPDRKDTVEATVTKIQDCSQYTVVFDDGDITTLRRTALCLKSGRHFNESETLDQLPLTHPEHFGNPVVGGRRGRRRHMNDESSDDGDESDTKEVVNEKEEHIGKVVCVETESKKKDKEKWFPGLVVSPNAQATVRIRVKDEYLVRSFKDGRYYTVPKKEATEFTREAAAKQDGPPVQAALEYLDNDILPPHWDRDALFGLMNSSSEDDAEIDSDSSDDEPREEKDRFVAQLYKYMDDRGTPLNKVPSIQSRDVDLYRLFRAVQKRGGYNRVTSQNQWKSIAIRLGFTPVTVSVTNLVKQAYKKFLQPYGEFHRKLGCSMLMTSRNSNRSKGRSLVRANSVASPKPAEPINKDVTASSTAAAKLISASAPHSSFVPAIASANTAAAPVGGVTASAIVSQQPSAAVTQSAAEESENTSESSIEASKTKRKTAIGNSKVKSLIEKYEEKGTTALIKDEGDVPLSKMKAAAAASMRTEEKESASVASASAQNLVTARDLSPSGLTKKEKHQKKQAPQYEEKRGKRKKDEVSVEKVDAGDFMVEIGDKLKVYYHEKKVTYEAKVIEITLQRGIPMYLVHYTGWNNRYDEWVPRERIAENLTKAPKQKVGRSSQSSGEKPKDTSPKATTSILQSAANVSAAPASIIVASTSVASKTPTPTTVRRGRGRSDSLPPRSTTPSSVASSSSRTKSPAASAATLKKKPTRISHPTSTHRRTSANVSDVSLPTETETDSDDEPVRKLARAVKEPIFKGGSPAKVPVKQKPSATSAACNQTDGDTEDDADDDDTALNSSTSRAAHSSDALNVKGRDYDLNQIRSELKGFQEIKSPSPSEEDASASKNVMGVKEEDLKTEPREDENFKIVAKEEPLKSSTTELSSEADSFADDDSQSSDKTTTLENMTKKFQQKINADKQRALVTAPSSGKVTAEKLSTLSTKTHIVEKIIKDSLAEKRQESLKANPSAATLLKEDTKALIKIELDLPSSSAVKSAVPTELCRPTALASALVKEENKKPQILAACAEMKAASSIIAPARFGGGSGGGSNLIGNKYTSVIVEKPLNVVNKKLETPVTHVKKHDTPKKHQQAITDSVLTKNVLDPASAVHKETVIKIEPPAVCSPTSSTSSSSSTSSTSSASSRSLPDMSKLDISGSSSTCSSLNPSSSSREAKALSSLAIPKSNSPDIYEFKDPEPFEYEMRKSILTPHSTVASGVLSGLPPSSSAAATASTSLLFDSKRKQGVQKTTLSIETPTSTPLVSLVNRKKRGSPMKDAFVEKTKQLRNEEKQPLVLEAKLMMRSSSTASGPVQLSSAGISTKNLTAAQNKNLSVTHASAAAATHPPSVSNAGVKMVVPPPPPPPTPVTTGQFSAPLQKREHKSPSCNLNINALNEELAQTVQETTRALTDALHTQTPITPSEFTPVKVGQTSASPPPSTNATKAVSSAIKVGCTLTASPKLVTPPPPPSPASPMKHVVGSPFIETCKDLSNVFEMTSSEGESSSGTSGHKDNRFELENVKILLSASASAFNLEPAKFENKPTSIADKVLKAISQKKEEVENKNKELKQVNASQDVASEKQTFQSIVSSSVSDNKQSSDAFSAIMKSPTTTDAFTTLPPTFTSTTTPQLVADQSKSSASLLLSSCSGKDDSLNKTDISSPLLTTVTQLTKRPHLSSPGDSKPGILESISVKNHDLSETIQKLECALQKKTPVPSSSAASSPVIALTAASPASNTAAAASATASAFSDDSMDSTDSERRLVIEDVEEPPSRKSPPPPGGTPPRTEGKGGDSQQEVMHAVHTTPVKVESQLVSLLPSASVVSAPTVAASQAAAVTIAFVPNPPTSPAIPMKMVTPGKPHTALTVATSTAATIPSKFVGKLHSNASAPAAVILTSKPIASLQQTQLIAPLKLQQQQALPSTQPNTVLQTHTLAQTARLASNHSAKPTEIIVATSNADRFADSKMTTGTPLKVLASQAPQRATAATVVPIVLPDIPVSVVVASSAVPSVVAAAQAAAAAAQQTPAQSKSPIGSKYSVVSSTNSSTLSAAPQATTSSFSANSASLKTFENAAAIRHISPRPIAVVTPSPPPQSSTSSSGGSGGISSSGGSSSSGVSSSSGRGSGCSSGMGSGCSSGNGGNNNTGFTQSATTAACSSVFFLGARTDIRPDDGVKPIGDELEDATINRTVTENNSVTASNAASSMETHHDSINLLLCEETIPGSPAPAFGKEESQPTHPTHRNRTRSSNEVVPMDIEDSVPISAPSKGMKTANGGAGSSVNPTPSSSPNDTASQDEMSSEDLKKNMDLGNEVSSRKRRRKRKKSEMMIHMNEQQTKRRRPLTCAKKNTAGSDSDDNSDTISQRSTTSARQQQLQSNQIGNNMGGKSCPYNFLVQLDPSMNPDQRIAILLKQIQDLRKTYNMIKGDLASIDRRRKKLRRREREKKQQMQQQQMKAST